MEEFIFIKLVCVLYPYYRYSAENKITCSYIEQGICDNNIKSNYLYTYYSY